MKKILITGFEPFDSDLVNPSKEFLSFLQLQKSQNNYFLECLPVTFKDSYECLEQKVLEIKPDILIMTGLAKNRQKVSLEKIAINWIDARIPDNNGLVPESQKISPVGRDGIFSEIKIEEFLNIFSDPNYEISYSAGTYVCNYVYYKALDQLNLPTLFIHLPGNERINNQEIFNLIFKIIEINF